MSTVTAPKGRPKKIIQVKDIKDLVEFLSAQSVRRFQHGDLIIEIDTVINATTKATSDELDNEARKTAALFSEKPGDADADLFWSSAK